MPKIDIDISYTLNLLTNLVSINSVNPLCDPTGKGEAEISLFLAGEMQKLGLDIHRSEIQPGRFNLIGRLPGTGNGKSLMFNAHTDTVGAGGMLSAFSPRVMDGRLYGRGAVDMKASLAAMLSTVQALRTAGIQLKGDLFLAAVADEEFGSIGTETLVHQFRTDGAVVTEPTNMQICRGHRGYVHFQVNVYGKAAHGSRYDEGIDANLMMGRFLGKLAEVEKELRQQTPAPLVGIPSLHAGLLQGGTELSIYAAKSTVFIERRTIPDEKPEVIMQEFQEILDNLNKQDPLFYGTVEIVTRREPFEVPGDAEIVRSLEEAMLQVLHTPPMHSGQWFWTDAALLAAAGIETVVLGPTGGGLHSDLEWVDLESVYQLAGVLAHLTQDYCGES
jgi:acetylornithine deacetylase